LCCVTSTSADHSAQHGGDACADRHARRLRFAAYFCSQCGGAHNSAADLFKASIDVGYEFSLAGLDWNGDGFKDLAAGSAADGTLDFFKGSHQDGTLAKASMLDMNSARRRWIGTVMDGFKDLIVGLATFPRSGSCMRRSSTTWTAASHMSS